MLLGNQKIVIQGEMWLAKDEIKARREAFIKINGRDSE
jgi:hypothetical protein